MFCYAIKLYSLDHGVKLDRGVNSPIHSDSDMDRTIHRDTPKHTATP